MVRHMLRFWLTSAFCLYQTCKWKCFTEKVECQNDLICFFSFRAQSLDSGHTEKHIKSIYLKWYQTQSQEEGLPRALTQAWRIISQRASSFTVGCNWKCSAQGCVTGHILSYPWSPMNTWLVTWLMWRCYCFSETFLYIFFSELRINANLLDHLIHKCRWAKISSLLV